CMLIYSLLISKIKKKILLVHNLRSEIFRLVFHFQTLLDNFERTVIDDSRLAGRPAEIFVGKMFKMEVWETLLTSMRVGEVAEFWCDAIVGDPMSYHRESWMMEKDEKLQTVPVLHMQGNALVKQRQFREAASKYKEAVLLLKTVQSREMPGDIDYINLGRMIIPLELNYCQCMLELEEYYEVIEHTTELLEKHKGKDCVKAYYKRAKAHAAVWNEKEARRDFNTVAHLDITLASLVNRELKALSERMKEKYWEEKETYWNMLEKKGATNEEVANEREGEDKGKQGDSENPRPMFISFCCHFFIPVSSFQHFPCCLSPPPPPSSSHLPPNPVSLCTHQVDQQGEDWESLENVRLPLTLNLSQCMLELKQYQDVVELNTKLLKKHKGNIC
uniref:AIP/AIPL N-terminal FKBP-type PPIase domain-containing protein n=1 Tax=Anabas testudineus TaxID=64144 RepID=A0A3Q1IV80_ANATE